MKVDGRRKRSWRFKDMTGLRFGRLTVLAEAGKLIGTAMSWRCLCDCGTESVVVGGQLRSGRTISCGCWRIEKMSKARTRHGMTRNYEHPSEYNVWVEMKQRCINPHCKSYKNYGARGIRVCERWFSFENFLADMGPRPEGLTIERINNDGNYEPRNCKWATYKEQRANQRKRHVISKN